MKRLLGSILVVACALICAGASAAGSDTLGRIIKNGVVRVGMSGDQAPLNFKSKGGSMLGLEVDLTEALAASMDVKLEIVQKPFGELLEALDDGDVDLVASGMTITPERNMHAAFVGPYFISGKSVLTRKAALESLDEKTELDVAELKLAALQNSTSQKFIELVAPKATLLPVSSYRDGVDLVIEGEASALIADYPICLLSVLRRPEAELATLTQPLTVEPIGIALPADDPLFVNLIENYLATLEATGLLEVLRQKWFHDASWVAQLP